MTSPLVSKIAAQIGRGMAEFFLPATLTRSVPASGENAWTPGTPSTVSYTCKAIHEEWNAGLVAGGLVSASERKVMILASTLEIEPQPGDVVTIRGAAFTIVPEGTGRAAVTTDPANAVWTCRAAK